MKHQYFGDISDYKKYSILRALTGSHLKMLVVWMLTPNDNRSDGSNIGFLNKPEEWRKHDPNVYDAIHESVIQKKKRHLSVAEQKGFVPLASYFSHILPDSQAERDSYFSLLAKRSTGHDIIFFDPDNGIATASITKGHKNSSKYVFWDEIGAYWQKGHSILIYQHFPRVNRVAYVRQKSEEIRNKLGNNEVISLRTPHMVYFYMPQARHKLDFDKLKKDIEDVWGEKVIVDQI